MSGLYFAGRTGIMSLSLECTSRVLSIFVCFQRYFVRGIDNSGFE